MAQDYGSPNYPIGRPGKSAYEAAAEAMERQRLHGEWHEEHPGDFNCPPALSNPNDYAAIERVDDLMAFPGGGTIEPGDAFGPNGKK